MVLIFLTLLTSRSTAEDTGISQLQKVFLAKELLPGLKTVAVISNIKETEKELKQLVVAGNAYSVKFDIYDVPLVPKVREAFQQVSRSDAKLIWLVNDRITNDKLARRLILERGLTSKIPVYSYSKEFLREGALFAFEKDASGEIVTLFNNKIGDLIGIKVPASFSSKVITSSQ